eukprot:TRINITY_DN108805_c0_g1_i1.p1 TRINITY_DN108805_c0_g1~~TRINITY_DN108805_c0_g1_i1.p1  ORF type:complete len:247 (-),score=43.94 TRINITY_DN108805_c0_g1_i1:302-982(-)
MTDEASCEQKTKKICSRGLPSDFGSSRPEVLAIYVTGNDGKHREAQHVVRQLCGDRVQLEREAVDLPELQGTPREISDAKTREAALRLEGQHASARFIITDDTGLGLSCLSGFPGVYIKPMLESLKDVGLAELVHRYEDHKAVATCTLGVWDRQNPGVVSCYEGSLPGRIVDKPAGDVKHGKVSWNTIFVPAGEKRTFGEMPLEEHAMISHRREAFMNCLNAIVQR